MPLVILTPIALGSNHGDLTNRVKTTFTPVGSYAGSRSQTLLVFEEGAGDPVELP